MPFPESKRVIYERNPLEEVVCQFRFPPILLIDAEVPAAFQERVRGRFPLYKKQVQTTHLNLQLPPEIVEALAPSTSTSHQFSSEDGAWTLSLTRDFLALTTSKYIQWSGFKDRLTGPLNALVEIYAPAFFTRVGLRYRDRIDRESLNLAAEPWSELLKGTFLGELADPLVGPNIERALRELVINLVGGIGKVRIVHGLQEDSKVYVIDSDFFREERTPVGEAWNVAQLFNQRAGRLFRWYITERLHDAMEPKEQ